MTVKGTSVLSSRSGFHHRTAKSAGWDKLTFDTRGEIIIFVGRNSRFARTLDAVLAFLAHLFFLHHRKLPSAHS